MDWPNEHWVKLYTRDTPERCTWPWQSGCVMNELIRKCDRSGQIGLGRAGVEGLAMLLRLPIDVVKPGLAGLLKDGCVTLSNAGNGEVTGTLTIENFVEAQESTTSNAERQRRFKDRRKLLKSQEAEVTRSNGRKRAVTTRVDESRVDEIRDQSPPLVGTQIEIVSPKPPKPQEIVFAAWKRELRKPDLPMGPNDFAIIGARLKDGCTVEQLCLVPVGARRDAERWPERRAQDEIKFLFGSLGQVRKFVDLASAQVIPRGESSASNFTENRPPPGRVKV